MAFDKNSFLAGLAVGRRITAMVQNNVSASNEIISEQNEMPVEDTEKAVKEDE